MCYILVIVSYSVCTIIERRSFKIDIYSNKNIKSVCIHFITKFCKLHIFVTLIFYGLSLVQRFTNEDHLTVHKKKHDMALNLENGQKTNVFVGEFILIYI